MAKTFQESYIDVERAYSQGQFQQALTQAEALLGDRPADADDLQYSRLQLLTGHIHMYGLKQPDKASTYYSQVVQSSQEPTYRDLARQGLDLCAGQRSKPEVQKPEVEKPVLEKPVEEKPVEEKPVEEKPSPARAPVDPPFLTKAAPATGGDRPTAAPAMPWLESTTPTSPAPAADQELVAEPLFTAEEEVVELIELPEEEPAVEIPDPTIVEALVVDAPEPEPEPEPEPAPRPASAFSEDERAQLAKGRLRVILR